KEKGIAHTHIKRILEQLGLSDRVALFDNDGRSSYRLKIPAHNIGFDVAELRSHAELHDLLNRVAPALAERRPHRAGALRVGAGRWHSGSAGVVPSRRTALPQGPAPPIGTHPGGHRDEIAVPSRNLAAPGGGAVLPACPDTAFPPSGRQHRTVRTL